MRNKISFIILATACMCFAGVVGGARGGVQTVDARSIDRYEFVLREDENTYINLSGDGDTDLDLYVYDENDNEVCSSTSNGDDEYCRINPKWTGLFKIRVYNRGTVYNRYRLTVE